MTAPELVRVQPRAADAYGVPRRILFPIGAWLVVEDGALQVQADGTVELRPTPWPWTRPSIAALPWLVVRG